MQVIVAGGGPAGSIAASKLASEGIRTILFETSLSGDKTCAGGIPSALVKELKLADEQIQQKCDRIRFFSPTGYKVELKFPNGGYLATVRRHEFDKYLRQLAEKRGVIIEEKEVIGYDQTEDTIKVEYKDKSGQKFWATADYLIGADGAVSKIARNMQHDRLVYVATMQEFIRPNPDGIAHWDQIAEFYYSSDISPDYYGWVFPHRGYISIGVGTHYENAKGISKYLDNLKKRNEKWLDGGEVLGRGSAPIPSTYYMEPAQKRVLLVGDAAGFVLPGCGEGIYYAIKSGFYAAQAIIDVHRLGHANPAISYNLRCEREFSDIFGYFKRIERIAFKNDFTRELFVRYTREPGAADNFLNAFSLKKKKKSSGLLSKIRRLIALNSIKSEIKREHPELLKKK